MLVLINLYTKLSYLNIISVEILNKPLSLRVPRRGFVWKMPEKTEDVPITEKFDDYQVNGRTIFKGVIYNRVGAKELFSPMNVGKTLTELQSDSYLTHCFSYLSDFHITFMIRYPIILVPLVF